MKAHLNSTEYNMRRQKNSHSAYFGNVCTFIEGQAVFQIPLLLEMTMELSYFYENGLKALTR